MSEIYRRTTLWRKSLGSTDEPYAIAIERLRVAYLQFREKAAQLTSQIHKSLPSLTVHGLTHLDALWETADLIAGPDYPLNPMEGFVFGGAILLHDSALCFEAYEEGIDGLRKRIEWKDAYAAVFESDPSADKSALELAADFAAMRFLHARQANTLATKGWKSDTGDIYLIDDSELRKCYGSLIGKIAESHNWPIEQVVSELKQQSNAPGEFPVEWRVDPIKIACLLRCADAAHIDDRRAPDFLRALIKQHGVSESHWRAQNWLARADLDQSDPAGHTLLVTSHRPFGIEDSDAWWVAHDALQLIDIEIRASNSLLSSRPQATKESPPFGITKVAGANSLEEICRHIEVSGWKPCSAVVHVGNIERLISNLGGTNLYGGASFAVVLRELIQNARDAVAARREIKGNSEYEGCIRIRLRTDPDGHEWIDVIDDGIGMSERVLTGPLLDFGTSFWITNLVRNEWPGLRSSKFRSVGQFGIGFYSIFMIASKVSIHSRRYDAAFDEMLALDFPNGLTLRPILSSSNIDYLGYSTIVTFRLKEAIKGFIEVKSNVMGENALHVKIQDYIAAIVAGLDVKVQIRQSGEENWQTVHYPITSLKTPIDVKKWLEKIAFASYTDNGTQALIDAIHNRLRPIIHDGSIYGLAAISTNLNSNIRYLGARTIGGLTLPSLSPDSFIGYMDYQPNSAKRDISNKLKAPPEAIKEWADQQIEILKNGSINDLEWCVVTTSLCDFDIDPTEIARMAFFKNGNLIVSDLPGVIRMARETGIAVFKSSFIDHVETHTNCTINNFPVFRPIKNSSFLDLSMENNAPKNINSFIGCLYRYAMRLNCELKFDIKKGALKSPYYPIDLMVIKAEVVGK